MTQLYHIPQPAQLPLFVFSKVCARCGKEKDLDQFYQSKNGKFGRRAECAACTGIPSSAKHAIAIFHGVMLRGGIICLISKSCTKCSNDKGLDEFYPKGNGYRAKCKQCENDETLQWHYDNPEKVKQHIQKRQADPKYIQYHREKEHTRYNTIPRVAQHASAYGRAYRKANFMKKREWNSRYDARKQSTSVGKVSYKRILEQYGYVCHICASAIDPKDLHFDHIIPLARGGSHTQDNVAPSHGVCNMRKKHKLMSELTAYDRRGP